jgi:hypothetical protein
LLAFNGVDWRHAVISNYSIDLRPARANSSAGNTLLALQV